MGNICAGNKEEETKPSTFQTTLAGETILTDSADFPDKNNRGGFQDGTNSRDVSRLSNSDPSNPTDNNNNDFENQHNNNNATSTLTMAEKLQEQKQLEALRLEQARMDLIVQNSNQKMVSVRSTRGSNAYYDQGFAAALSQHLEQTTQFPDSLIQRPLPAAHPHESVYQRLSQPTRVQVLPPHRQNKETDTTAAGTSSSASASSSQQQQHALMDRIAESLLEEVVPNKERLFARVDPMVESLL